MPSAAAGGDDPILRAMRDSLDCAYPRNPPGADGTPSADAGGPVAQVLTLVRGALPTESAVSACLLTGLAVMLILATVRPPFVHTPPSGALAVPAFSRRRVALWVLTAVAAVLLWPWAERAVVPASCDPAA